MMAQSEEDSLDDLLNRFKRSSIYSDDVGYALRNLLSILTHNRELFEERLRVESTQPESLNCEDEEMVKRSAKKRKHRSIGCLLEELTEACIISRMTFSVNIAPHVVCDLSSVTVVVTERDNDHGGHTHWETDRNDLEMALFVALLRCFPGAKAEEKWPKLYEKNKEDVDKQMKKDAEAQEAQAMEPGVIL